MPSYLELLFTLPSPLVGENWSFTNLILAMKNSSFTSWEGDFNSGQGVREKKVWFHMIKIGNGWDKKSRFASLSFQAYFEASGRPLSRRPWNWDTKGRPDTRFPHITGWQRNYASLLRLKRVCQNCENRRNLRNDCNF